MQENNKSPRSEMPILQSQILYGA